jgi:hypothetical protein
VKPTQIGNPSRFYLSTPLDTLYLDLSPKQPPKQNLTMLRRLRAPAPIRSYATQAPPPIKPYQTGPLPPKALKPAPTPKPTTEPITPARSFLDREPLDPARGVAASLRVVREGVLDPRYKPASRRVIAIICAVPIFIVTSWVLFQRQFLGVEQRKHTGRGGESEGVDGPAVEVVGEGVGVVDAK